VGIFKTITEGIRGVMFALKFWEKRKDRKRREKSIDAISDSKRYDDKYK